MIRFLIGIFFIHSPEMLLVTVVCVLVKFVLLFKELWLKHVLPLSAEDHNTCL